MPIERQMPSLAQITGVAKAQKKQKEAPKVGILRAYIVFAYPLEAGGVKYAKSTYRGKERDPHRNYITKETENDKKWVGKAMTLAQAAGTDAFAEIIKFMAMVWVEHPAAIRVAEIYLNTVNGKPCILKYDKEMLAEVEKMLFSDDETK